MSAQLIAPRPLRLSGANRVPFFLSNHLSATSPVSPPVLVGVESAGNDCGALKPGADKADTQPISGDIVANKNNPDMAIEDLAARIRLDDEVVSTTTAPNISKEPLIGLERASTSPVHRTIIAEEIAKIAPPRSPEDAAAALDEFLSILRPVIRAPASPIARSKRLVPRSRHTFHHTGSNGPNQDRHHPYARSAKSTSPSERADGSDTGSLMIGVSSKRASARSPASLCARRRSSNANESSYSCGSASICSSRSQSVSRRGSDGYLNAWTAAAACKWLGPRLGFIFGCMN
ncbi:hypothetical protein M408DRAFT_250150 [Serendipita vermifera MAFF 305830]|uniref:Uncharacterized protein n=1 Tax=Serendipita vermifera MAFF 305830 TaxID=933852 RepID=A0A0C3AX04_SERVB|nr:hypothetical protein M408DRAFT_250150 [Serendipita vermifera MAFF 305830]